MSSLNAFLADATLPVSPAHRVAEAGALLPKGAYIAIGFALAGLVPDVGGSFTPAGTPATPIVASGGTMASILKNLNYQNKGWFFGDGLVMGKKAKPENRRESQPMGSRTEGRTTGEVKERADITVKNTFLNAPFWNTLRAGGFGPLDVFLFTNKTVQVVRYGTHAPVFLEIGSELGGNYENETTGGFAMAWEAYGEIDPIDGVKLADLKYESLAYTFAAPTPAPTNLTLIAGTTNRYKVTTTGTAAKFTRTVNEPGDVRYSITKSDGSALEAATSINTDTGEVTLLGTLAIGRYVYRITAENTNGIRGAYLIEIVVA